MREIQSPAQINIERWVKDEGMVQVARAQAAHRQVMERFYAEEPDRQEVNGRIEGCIDLVCKLERETEDGARVCGEVIRPGYSPAHEVENHVGIDVELSALIVGGILTEIENEGQYVYSYIEDGEEQQAVVEDVTSRDFEAVQTALWLHDLGYFTGPDNFIEHERIGAEMAGEYLRAEGRNEEFIAVVQDLIISTDLDMSDVPKYVSAQGFSTVVGEEARVFKATSLDHGYDRDKLLVLCEVVKRGSDLMAFATQGKATVQTNVSFYKENLMRYARGEKGALWADYLGITTSGFLYHQLQAGEELLRLIGCFDEAKGREFRERAEDTMEVIKRMNVLMSVPKVDAGLFLSGSVSVEDMMVICQDFGISEEVLGASFLDIARGMLIGVEVGEEGALGATLPRLPTAYLRKIIKAAGERKGEVVEAFIRRMLARAERENVVMEELRVAVKAYCRDEEGEELIGQRELLERVNEVFRQEGRERSGVCWVVRRDQEGDGILRAPDSFVAEMVALHEEGLINAVAIGGRESHGQLQDWVPVVQGLLEKSVPVRVFAGQFREGELEGKAREDMETVLEMHRITEVMGTEAEFRVVGANVLGLAVFDGLRVDFEDAGVRIEYTPGISGEMGLAATPLLGDVGLPPQWSVLMKMAEGVLQATSAEEEQVIREQIRQYALAENIRILPDVDIGTLNPALLGQGPLSFCLYRLLEQAGQFKR
ncbi:hypothetical protein KKB83_04440 [Patescibacteria group bacterium]|nr:hypothetical protein [Patescibacteria group bacterium]